MPDAPAPELPVMNGASELAPPLPVGASGEHAAFPGTLSIGSEALAACLIEPGGLDRSGPGEAVLLWRDEHSEAWLNLWWQPRDTGYHDHTGSCVGVHVIEGRAWNEALTIGEPPEASEYGPGESFWFPGEGIHRMDHQAGAITIHVYSPPIQAIGHYDLHDGQLRRTPLRPDQPSPPSAALYEALHPRADAGQASRDLANLGHRGRLRPVLVAAGLVAAGEDRGLERLGFSSPR